MQITLKRISSPPSCTFGILSITEEPGWHCFTLELPWRENQRCISCIPPAMYRCAIGWSQKNGRVINVINVPGRDGIQFHVGNYPSDIQGCILVGNAISRNMPAVLDSRKCFSELLEKLEGEPIWLDLDSS